MKTLNTLLGFMIFISVLSGCTARSINTPNENIKETESVKEPFIIVNRCVGPIQISQIW